MSIFDFFKKINPKNKGLDKENSSPISNISELNFSQNVIYEKNSLKKVFAHNIQNGIFTIPSFITTIDMFAFSHLENLQTVIMHKDIKYIAPNAFLDCKNLREIKNLEQSKTMKSVAGFNSCENLKLITLPESTQFIGQNAFENCKSLQKIILPENCWCIGTYAFAGCENLETIKIPANMELIDSGAFAGCRNLTIIFLDDNQRYLQDIINEQKIYLEQSQFSTEHEYNYPDFEYFDSEKQPALTDEEKEVLYNDLDIRYRKINIDGKEILWTIGKTIIKEGALDGVKEVITFRQDLIETIIKSGFKGKITYIDKEKQESISFDFGSIENFHKQQVLKSRENYYKNTIIPSGGTINWLINCEKHNYYGCGYTNDIVCEIPISFDSRIIITDHSQPKNGVYNYNKEYEEFYTSLSFLKQELITNSIYEPHTYERYYPVYYDYGARFNNDFLFELGTALNNLINQARDLEETKENQPLLSQIQTAQKELITLLINGTTNKNAVTEIMKKVPVKTSLSTKIREASSKKDWLPHFTEPLFSEFKELEDYRNTQNTENQTSQPT